MGKTWREVGEMLLIAAFVGSLLWGILGILMGDHEGGRLSVLTSLVFYLLARDVGRK